MESWCTIWIMRRKVAEGVSVQSARKWKMLISVRLEGVKRWGGPSGRLRRR